MCATISWPRPAHQGARRADEPTRIWNPQRGVTTYPQVYAAYRAPSTYQGQPTVNLAKTIKGYSLGAHFPGRNATHQ